MDKQSEISIQSWVENLQSQGKYSFSLMLLQAQLTSLSDKAIKSALNRLSKKKLIASIHKGFYVIVTPQYKTKGILPPSLYLDVLMKELHRPYYVALLNAAAYHGASHQQPQEFFVVTTFPVLRPTLKKGLKVNYISKKELPEKLIETKNTEAGYLKISNPILTATDLIQFEKRVGGMNRVATVLYELADAIMPQDFNEHLLQNIPTTVLQRLGYLLDKVLDNQPLANALYDVLKQSNATLFRIALKPSVDAKGFSADDKWKVIVNTQIEIDE